MYFESVLSYLATFINDISLMNLSIRLPGHLYISSFRPLCFNPVLMFRLSVSSSQRFNLFYPVIELRPVTPVLFGTAKVEIFFCFANLFQTFFSLAFLCFTSSEAGCKSRKIQPPRKHLSTISYKLYLTRYTTIRKINRKLISP